MAQKITGHAGRLRRRAQELGEALERLQLTEYLRYLDDVRLLLWRNFLSGLARGVGMAVGFTVLGAVLVASLQRIAVDRLPVLGKFLADVVRLVQENLGRR
ncbi:MAG: DUF5665 domain-containing protein [Oscillospiraceae bacterium]|jgi:hypothetical protein|nr:DUF5665 domain-containing protein [Oscillospiraceae bacterium]